MLGYVHFMDGIKEEIIKKWQRNGVYYVKTMSATFMYKNVYVPNAFSRLFDGYDWIDLCYYKHIQEITEDGGIVDKWVKAPVDKITYVRPKFKNHCIIPMLKNVLAVRDMTLKELSWVTGIPKTTLEKYITGEVEPRPATIERIAEYLDIDISVLTGNDYIGLETDIVTKHDEKVIAKRKEEAANASLVMKNLMKFIEDSRD